MNRSVIYRLKYRTRGTLNKPKPVLKDFKNIANRAFINSPITREELTSINLDISRLSFIFRLEILAGGGHI